MVERGPIQNQIKTDTQPVQEITSPSLENQIVVATNKLLSAKGFSHEDGAMESLLEILVQPDAVETFLKLQNKE